ncbi:ATP-dependent DNA helicase, partial [Oceanospirillum sp. HFRX-1_2]
MKVAVRSLCEFAARNGSLEFRYTPSPTAEEGIRGHQKLQKRRINECGPDVTYEPEHLLEGHIQGIDLKGRADGYLSPITPHDNASSPLLEEIKTHRGELDRIGDGQRQLHLAQLKVYGALLCLRDKRSAVRLRLVYYDIDRDQESPDESLWQASVLIPFAEDLCRQYANWHRQEAEHRLQRDS